jgi:hypothetical protein
MKTFSKIFIVCVLLTMSGLMKPQQTSAQGVGISFQLFYDELSPYGQWVEYPGYNYVWIPEAGPEFSPYATAGHWVLTEYGWTWFSDYPWGWAPFHYGRWFFDDYYGWMWVPGRQWGPAWVQWRRCEGYYGWAPLYPGIRVEASFDWDYHVHGEHWRFVHDRDFCRDDVDHYYINHRENSMFLQSSTVINNTYIDNSSHRTYISGPGRSEVQKYSGREIRAYPIKENPNPGQAIRDNQLVVYKPVVQKTNGGVVPIPRKAVPIKDAKSWSQRTSQNPNQNIKPIENNAGKAQPMHQNNANPQYNREQGGHSQPATPNHNNTGKAQPIHQNNATSPDNQQHKVQSHPATPQNNNMGKAQPIQHSGGNPSVTPQKQAHPQGSTPVNTKKAEPEKKKESPERK